MQAADYRITFGYGATDDDYYGPAAVGKPTYIGPYHRGDDRAMPVGTPVVVNGTVIGLSGNGNGLYGAHLHIGRFVNGKDTNPNGQGFSLEGAKVVSLLDNYSGDPVNGKYIRIQDSTGAVWVYLHMSKVNVTVGQELKGDDMPTLANREFVQAAYQIILGRDASQVSEEELKARIGSPVDEVFFALAASSERDNLSKYVIKQLYKGALQRTPSEEEVNGWLQFGLRSQADRITNSDEAKAVTAQYQSGSASFAPYSGVQLYVSTKK